MSTADVTDDITDDSFEDACDRLFSLHANGFNPREAAARRVRSRAPMVAARVRPGDPGRAPARGPGRPAA